MDKPICTSDRFAALLSLSKESYEIKATAKKIVRGKNDLSDEESSQLSFLISSPSIYFGNPKSIKEIDDCFNRMNVDNGQVHYSRFEIEDETHPDILFHYWLGYFGGNPTGYLLLRMDQESEEWSIIVENCDGDFIYRGPGNNVSSKSFITAVKKAAYGDKYDEDEEDE